MKSITRQIATVAIACTLLSGSAFAQGRARGHVKKGELKSQKTVVFTPDDRAVVSNYYVTDRRWLPAGFVKRDRLPPGLARQLQVGGVLPRGLRSHLRPVPGEIDRRMRPLPSGYRRGLIGDDIVVVDTHNWLVEDVIRDAIHW